MDDLDDMPLAERIKLRRLTTHSPSPRPSFPRRCSIGESIGRESSRVLKEWPGLPRGVQFIPTDADLLWHLLAKVGKGRADPHPFIHKFITCLDEFTGFGCTHPRNLPGMRKDGSTSYFFHKSFKAHDSKDGHNSCDRGGVCWQKTGETNPLLIDGQRQGYRTVMILHTSMQEAENHNWVMHQYHLGMEIEGDFVVSKIFSQMHINENVKDTTLKAKKVVPKDAESAIFSKSTAPKIHNVDQHLDLTPKEATSKHIVMVDYNTKDSLPLKGGRLADQNDTKEVIGSALQSNESEVKIEPLEEIYAHEGLETTTQMSISSAHETNKRNFVSSAAKINNNSQEKPSSMLCYSQRKIPKSCECPEQPSVDNDMHVNHRENTLLLETSSINKGGNSSSHPASFTGIVQPNNIESRTSRAKVKEEPNDELLEDMQNKSINNNLENCQQFFPRKMCEPDNIANAQCSRRKRKKTATDSVKQALEEDAPGLLQVLLGKGISVDEIKLYGASEDDDTMETSLADDDFDELEIVINKIFSTRDSLFKFPVARSSKSSKAIYCLSCLISLIEQARYLQFRNNPIEWGWSRDLQSFIFVFIKHNRIVLERPEYGYATYFFEIVHSLSIDWQIKRLVTTMKLTSCSRTTLIENRPLVVGEDLTQGEARVLAEYGWIPNCGLGSMLHFCGRVVHDNKNEEYNVDWRAKIGNLLSVGHNSGRIELVNVPKKAVKLENLEIKEN